MISAANVKNWLYQMQQATHPIVKDLVLVGGGHSHAIASWGLLGWQFPLLWRWKDHIDRKFMQRFSDLPQMSPSGKPAPRLRDLGY